MDAPAAAPTPPPPAARPAAPLPADVARAARFGLVVLTLINLFNYIDRYVVSAIEESLKGALALSDAQAGSLMTGFIVVYMLTSPFFGTLGDQRSHSRPRLIALGVASWSLATAAAGFTWSFLSLFVARAAVGVGEAAYGTIGPTLLSDYYPRKVRGRVFAIFFAAIPIGSALGYAIGGAADKAFGWRAAFLVAGLPGLLLAVLALRLLDPERGQQDADEPEILAHAHAPASGFRAYGDLLKNVPYLYVVGGLTAYTWAIGGLAFWMPPFLTRVRGVPKHEAAIQFGAILVVAGFVGTFAGGWLGDWLLRRTKQAYLWLSGVTALAAVPVGWLALTSGDRAVYLPAIFLAEVLLFASTGPINTAIVNVVPPTQRATAMAGSIFAIHALGDAISPLIIGAVSDATSLAHAVLLVPVAIAAGGAIWTYAAWRG